MNALPSIPALDKSAAEILQSRIDNKTKPPGSLGRLESLAQQLALIAGDPIRLNKPSLLLFAADHGIADEGVSIAPAAVTRLMVQNFIAGGAAINCFSRQLGWDLHIIDAGIAAPLCEVSPSPAFHELRMGTGTANFAHSAAMSEEQANACLQAGASVANERMDAGSNVIAFGEMGIANTSSASAITCALLDCKPALVVGRGTGISDQQLANKSALIEKALTRLENQEPMHVLQELGGFEIGQMTGAMLAAAARQSVLVIDGFIATAAALLAVRLQPACRDYMVFAHRSDEQAHQLQLESLSADPLLDLQLRLGEGTGAALALPLLQSAAAFFNDMADLDQTQIDLP